MRRRGRRGGGGTGCCCGSGGRKGGRGVRRSGRGRSSLRASIIALVFRAIIRWCEAIIRPRTRIAISRTDDVKARARLVLRHFDELIQGEVGVENRGLGGVLGIHQFKDGGVEIDRGKRGGRDEGGRRGRGDEGGRRRGRVDEGGRRRGGREGEGVRDHGLHCMW